MIRRSSRGATQVEYLVLVGVVALAGIGAFLKFGGQVRDTALCMGEAVLSLDPAHCGKGDKGNALARNSAEIDASHTAARGDGLVRLDPSGICTGQSCGRPGQCFAAGTMVRTESGMRAIETFKQGEKLLAGNDETLTNGTFEIEKVVVTENQEVLELTVESENATETIKPTLRHAFWVESDWVKAMDLKENDVIRTTSGSKARVASVKMTGEKTTVYNLEVKDVHTYYVGKTGLFSHNACERVPPTKRLRELATTGELWEKKRFDAVNKLAACRDLTESDYAILADAVRGEKAAKESYLSTMKNAPSYTSAEGRSAVDEAMGRRWFDRAEQALQAASQEGDKSAQRALSSLSP